MSNNKLTVEMVDALKFQPRLYLCGQCGGAGAQRSFDSEEERLGVEDTCYHCQGGLVDEEVHFHDLLAGLAADIAAERVRDATDGGDSEDGFDIGLMAAENMMTVREYKYNWVATEAEKIVREFEAMPRRDQEALLRQNGLVF